MSRLTRSNIAYDLNVSPHFHTVEYKDGPIRYVFSSELYRNSFKTKLEANREKINTSLSNRFGFAIVNDKLADIKLYHTVEKRGFLIFQNGIKFEWADNLKLDGHHLMKKN